MINRDELQKEIERSLTLAEAAEYLAAPITAEERAETLQLIDWFQRRYPTPLERFRYVTQAYRRWIGR